MERLSFESEENYKSIEGAIHVARYLLTKNFCADRKILDIACGEGYGSYLMSTWGAKHVIGMDISSEAINNAKRKFKNDNLEYKLGSVSEMAQYEDHTFDLIISLETIEHLINPEEMLVHMKRLIKPDGIIIISCPNDYLYYPTEETSNPYHVKKYKFQDFQLLTEKIIGKAHKYQIGTPLNGFINIDFKSINTSTTQLDMFHYKENFSSLLLEPDKDINDLNCSYFVGYWGRFDNKIVESSCLYPKPMEVYDFSLVEYVKKQKKIENNVNIERLGVVMKSLEAENIELRRIIIEKDEILQSKLDIEQKFNIISSIPGYKLMVKLYKLLKK